MEKVEESKENQTSEKKPIDKKDSEVLEKREEPIEESGRGSVELPDNDVGEGLSSEQEQFDSQRQEDKNSDAEVENPEKEEPSEEKKEAADQSDLESLQHFPNDHANQEVLSAEEINEQILMAKEDTRSEAPIQTENSNTDQDTLLLLNQKLTEKNFIIEQQTREIYELKTMINSYTHTSNYKEPETNYYHDDLWEEVNIEDRYPDLEELWISKKIKQNLNRNAKKGFKSNALTLKTNVQSKLSSSGISIVSKPFIGY